MVVLELPREQRKSGLIVLINFSLEAMKQTNNNNASQTYHLPLAVLLGVRQSGDRILIRVVSNQARGFYDVPRVSIVMPCDFRIWAPFCCGWHTWPRSNTTSLDIVQLSRNHPRRETPIQRTYLIFE